MHDNRAGDVRHDAEHDDGKLRQAAAGENVQHAEKFVAGEKLGQSRLVNARNRNGRQSAEKNQHAQSEKYSLAQNFVLENRIAFC